MPWLALPFEDATGRARLSNQFGVRGIPRLVILGADGQVGAPPAGTCSRLPAHASPWLVACPLNTLPCPACRLCPTMLAARCSATGTATTSPGAGPPARRSSKGACRWLEQLAGQCSQNTALPALLMPPPPALSLSNSQVAVNTRPAAPLLPALLAVPILHGQALSWGLCRRCCGDVTLRRSRSWLLLYAAVLIVGQTHRAHHADGLGPLPSRAPCCLSSLLTHSACCCCLLYPSLVLLSLSNLGCATTAVPASTGASATEGHQRAWRACATRRAGGRAQGVSRLA